MIWEDRIKIKLLLHQGKTNTEIAKVIGKNKSTVGRELRRNTGGRGYRVLQAQCFAEAREELKHVPHVLTESLKKDISKRLKMKWSEQISNRIKFENKPSARAETIYKLFTRIKKLAENCGNIFVVLTAQESVVFPLVNAEEGLKMSGQYPSEVTPQMNARRQVIGSETR